VNYSHLKSSPFGSVLRKGLPHPSFASGSQEIEDFLGVALAVQQQEVRFARSSRQTYNTTAFTFQIARRPNCASFSLRSRGLILK